MQKCDFNKVALQFVFLRTPPEGFFCHKKNDSNQNERLPLKIMEWTPLNKMTYKNDLKGWLPIIGNDFH